LGDILQQRRVYVAYVNRLGYNKRITENNRETKIQFVKIAKITNNFDIF
jgi:hypothetical protein